MMRFGRDAERICSSCPRPVRTSEVVRWPGAARCWWFLTGLCRTCQEMS